MFCQYCDEKLVNKGSIWGWVHESTGTIYCPTRGFELGVI